MNSVIVVFRVSILLLHFSLIWIVFYNFCYSLFFLDFEWFGFYLFWLMTRPFFRLLFYLFWPFSGLCFQLFWMLCWFLFIPRFPFSFHILTLPIFVCSKTRFFWRFLAAPFCVAFRFSKIHVHYVNRFWSRLILLRNFHFRFHLATFSEIIFLSHFCFGFWVPFITDSDIRFQMLQIFIFAWPFEVVELALDSHVSCTNAKYNKAKKYSAKILTVLYGKTYGVLLTDGLDGETSHRLHRIFIWNNN